MSRRTILAQVRVRCLTHLANGTASQICLLQQCRARITPRKHITLGILLVLLQRPSIPTRLVPHQVHLGKVSAFSAAALAMAATLDALAFSALTATTNYSHRQGKETVSPAPSSNSHQHQQSRLAHQAVHSRLRLERAQHARKPSGQVLAPRRFNRLSRSFIVS